MAAAESARNCRYGPGSLLEEVMEKHHSTYFGMEAGDSQHGYFGCGHWNHARAGDHELGATPEREPVDLPGFLAKSDDPGTFDGGRLRSIQAPHPKDGSRRSGQGKV